MTGPLTILPEDERDPEVVWELTVEYKNDTPSTHTEILSVTSADAPDATAWGAYLAESLPVIRTTTTVDGDDYHSADTKTYTKVKVTSVDEVTS